MSAGIATRKVTGELIPASEMSDIIKLDEAVRTGSTQIIEAEQAGNEMTKAFVMARVMRQLRALLNDKVMADIMELKGSAAGFKTDEFGDKKYSLSQTRDVVILGLMRGLRVTGNEINIIGSNLYVTKEGFGRLLRELPGLTNLRLSIGVFSMNGSGDGAMVPCVATWKQDGSPCEMRCEKDTASDYRIVVRVNKGMGPDAIIGKAESKLLRRIYARITGSELSSDGDADDDERSTTEEVPKPNPYAEAARQRAERLTANAGDERQPGEEEDQ